MDSQLLPQPIIDAIDNPIILKNQSGVVLGCNQAFLRYCNLPASKIIGFTVYDFLSKEEADCHSKADQELLHGSKNVIQYAYLNEMGVAAVRPREIHKSIIRNSPDDADFGILVVIGKETSNSRSLLAGAHLTPRESLVLELLVQGNSQKQIARRLNISHHTVADHCKIIYQKLGVHSRTEAQLLAITKLGISAGNPDLPERSEENPTP